MLKEGGIYLFHGIKWQCQTVAESMSKLVALEKLGDRKPHPVYVSSNSELKEVSEPKEKKKE